MARIQSSVMPKPEAQRRTTDIFLYEQSIIYSRQYPDGGADARLSASPAFRITAIQTGLAAVQQDERGGVALAAELRAGREVAGGLGLRFDSARLGRAKLRANGFVGTSSFLGARGRGRTDHRPAHLAGGGYFSFFF